MIGDAHVLHLVWTCKDNASKRLAVNLAACADNVWAKVRNHLWHGRSENQMKDFCKNKKRRTTKNKSNDESTNFIKQLRPCAVEFMCLLVAVDDLCAMLAQGHVSTVDIVRRELVHMYLSKQLADCALATAHTPRQPNQLTPPVRSADTPQRRERIL